MRYKRFGSNGGFVCTECKTLMDGATVTRTVRGPNFVMRERTCPHCGFVHETAERVIRDDRDKQNFLGMDRPE